MRDDTPFKPKRQENQQGADNSSFEQVGGADWETCEESLDAQEGNIAGIECTEDGEYAEKDEDFEFEEQELFAEPEQIAEEFNEEAVAATDNISSAPTHKTSTNPTPQRRSVKPPQEEQQTSVPSEKLRSSVKPLPEITDHGVCIKSSLTSSPPPSTEKTRVYFTFSFPSIQ